MEDKSCYKKTQQRSFWLDRDQAAACCRAHPVEFKGNLNQLIDLWNREDQQMKQGHEVTSCDHCWIYERQGIQSYRQQSENDTLSQFEIIDIDFSNLCNHMCVYCSPKYSSMWEESIRTHGTFQLITASNQDNLSIDKPPMFAEQNFNVVLDYLSSRKDNSVVLSFLGGEPLMQQRSIEKILEIVNSKIARLIISTNLNPPSNRILKQMIDKLTNNNKLYLSISMDASPEFNHVSRAGFDQLRFLDNLHYVKEKNINIMFTGVYNAISVFDLDNLINWHKKNNHSYIIKPLNNPDILQVKYLPLKYRQKIQQGLSDTRGLPEFVKQSLEIADSPRFYQQQQYNYLVQYFKRTGINPESELNELFVEWWKETKELFG